MQTRSTILSLAALATLSLSALAPSQALAWGHGGWGHHGGGHRFEGGYGRSMGYFGRFRAPQLCEESGSRIYAEGARSFGSMRYAQSFGGRFSHQGFGRGQGGRPHGHRDSYEATPEMETEAPVQQVNPNEVLNDYSSKELQK